MNCKKMALGTFRESELNFSNYCFLIRSNKHSVKHTIFLLISYSSSIEKAEVFQVELYPILFEILQRITPNHLHICSRTYALMPLR